MKKITFLFIAAMLVSFGFAQQVVLQDFENGGLGGPFGGAQAAITPDPAMGGTNGNVAMLTSDPSGAVFQGININLLQDADLTTDITMQIDVYSLDPITIAPKVLSGTGPDSTSAVSHTGTGWETLTITFNQGLDNTTTADGTYSLFVIYYNWDSSANGFGTPDDRVFYVDNITGEAAAPVTPNPPATAAPAPPAAPDNEIISIYSDAYAQQPLNFDAGFCGFNSTTELQVQGDNLAWFRTNACQGIQLNNPVDASSFTTFHFDYYIDDQVDLTNKVLSLKLVDTNTPSPTDDDFIDIVLSDDPNAFDSLTKGQWVSLSVPVNLSAFGTFNEFVITAATLPNNLYYDNVYLSGGTLSNDEFEINSFSVFPNPTTDVWNIDTKNVNVQTVEIFNTLGRLVKSVEVNNTKVNINANDLSSGIYFARINSQGNPAQTIKLIRK